jgi:carbamoyltransferase
MSQEGIQLSAIDHIAFNQDNRANLMRKRFSSAFEELLGPRRKPHDPLEDRHCDIARSGQAMYEETFSPTARCGG